MDDIELHGWLVDMATDAFDSSDKARKGAERSSDYYDGKQWTVEEAKKIRKRGEPVISFNMIRDKIDYLQGLERQQRTVPRALPRTPMHEQDSAAVTDSLRYVCDDQHYSDLKSMVWGDMLKAGWGGIEITVTLKKTSLSSSTAMTQPDYDVMLKRCAWDRMVWDPYSEEDDYSDATYLGLIVWMDRDEAVRRYGEGAASVFDETVSIGTSGETWDDKPKLTWVNSAKRRRIRVIQIYYIDADGEWSYAEFTKGGLLKTGQSPWLDEDQEREHPYAWRASYTDRDNVRYGPIRDLIDPQDEVNKRRSKRLHRDNSRQTYGNERVKKVKENKQQLQRPDGHVELEGEAEFGKDFGIIPQSDQAQGDMELLQQAMSAMQVMGPNAAMQGKQEGSQSGRAILAQQQGGQTQMGLLTDALRQMDMQVYRKIWNRIRQFWTGERWIRVTDDQRNMKWVGVNPAQPYDLSQTPNASAMQQPIASVDIDIILDDAPMVGALMDEQFSLLVDLKKMDRNNEIPFKALIAAAPNLRSKAELLKAIEAKEKQPPNPLQMQGAQIELQGKVAEVKDKNASATLKIAQAQEALADAGAAGQPQATELVNPIEVDKTLADIDNTRAHTAKILTEANKAHVDTHMNALNTIHQITQPPAPPASATPGAGANGQ